MKNIRVAIAGLGNCAGSLIEGLTFYQNSDTTEGLLFPTLGGYSIKNIEIVCAFDISSSKVGKKIRESIYISPNNFERIPNVNVHLDGVVYRGPTLDGHPEHLKVFFEESLEPSVDVVRILKENKIDILLCLLPTGSVEATEYYGKAALEAGCAFINCIPTIFSQRNDMASAFKEAGLPLLGDDIKSQVGSTIIHRTILNMLIDRGAKITKSSQINIGGNTDFANFVYRAHTKLISKYKSLSMYLGEHVPNHIGHHYDVTKGPFKKTLFDIEAEVFAGSKVKISVQLQSDDKPNSSGSIIDLIRIAASEKNKGNGGPINEACAYYMKSPPKQMLDKQAYEYIKTVWG